MVSYDFTQCSDTDLFRSTEDGVLCLTETVGSYYYGAYHPMKPFRIAMAHHLVLAYDLHKHLDVFKPPPASEGATKDH